MPTDQKPVLKMHQFPIYAVHRTRLEAYIKLVFGFEFDFLTAAAVAEGTGVDYVVEKVPDSQDWQRRANSLRAGQRTKEVRLILAVLAQDGFIPFGKYTIVTKPLPDPINTYRSLLQRLGDPTHPECVKFKQENRGNMAFVDKSLILDRAMKGSSDEPTRP